MKKLKIFLVLISILLFHSFVIADYNSLKEAVTDTASIKEYSLTENEIITEDLGQLGGTQLTIFGNGYKVNGSSKAGITVGSGQTLNIEKGTGENFVWEKFKKVLVRALGGAIYVENGIIEIHDHVTFSSNAASPNANGALGGAICSVKNGIIEIYDHVTFSSNTAGDAGGAIYGENGIIKIHDHVTFSSNAAQSGGAIFNYTAVLTIEDNVIFERNSSSDSGGAIHNYFGIMNLIANTGNIEFTGNKAFYGTANEVSNAIHDQSGTINLWASEDASVIFNDRITSYDNTSTLNINSEIEGVTESSGTGKIVLNEDMSGYTGAVNVYGGEIELQAKTEEVSNVNTNKFFSGNVELSSGTLNIKNNAIDNITVNSLVATSNANLQFDTDLSNNTSDNFTVTNSASGELNLTAINILGVAGKLGQITLFNNGKSPELNILTTGNYGGQEYVFTNSDIAGVLNYRLLGCKTFKEIINDNTESVRSYSLAEDEIVTEDLGNLGGTELTIFGNGYKVNGSSKAGITVGSGQTLNIEKGTGENFVWEKFDKKETESGGVIYNDGNGRIKIHDHVTFSSNAAQRGGAIFNHSAVLTIGDNVIFERNSSSDSGGAIYNYHGIINLIANTGNIEFTGNKAFYGTANEVSNAIHDQSGTINLWASEDASVIFNDRITSENSSSVLNINKSSGTLPTTGKIILNENMGGYTGQVNFYNGTIKLGEKGTLFGGNMFVDNATIDMANEIIQEHNFNTLTINNTLNLVVDADLQNKKMDTISAANFNGTGKIKVNAINILSDNNEKETTEILFTNSTVLKDKITSVNTVSSKLYKYDVIYNNGYFNFTNTGGNKPEINPILLEASIANSVGGFITQTTIFNQAFASMENIKSRILQVKNEIPVDSPLYASRANTIFFQKTNRIESGLWLRPFYSQERINLDNLPVDNTLTGTLAGLDLATGENSLVSLYLGYAGSEQKYENIKVSQTGYILGATGMLVKEQWYAGLTANINFNKAESQSSYGTDNFDMNMYSVGAKAGYNFDLSDKWKLEPNLMLMYGNVNSQEYQTKQGAKVEGQSVANIVFEPQIKAKLNLENGWQPYGLIGYVVNAGDKVTTKVEEVEFDGQKIGNYVEFGAGVDKSFKNSPWSLYIQLTGRSGDRTGFDGNFGIKYSFLTAKEKRKIAKIKKIQEKRKAKKELLKERRTAETEE